MALRIQADYSESQMRQLSDGLLDLCVMYTPRTTPGLIIEELLVEKLVLVSTAKRSVSGGWVEDYVFVDWGPEFYADHTKAFPDLPTPAITVGLGDLGLRSILQTGGSGYFPLRIVKPLIAEKKLFRVTKAPEFRRPAYVVYSAAPMDKPLVDLGLDGLRQAVRD